MISVINQNLFEVIDSTDEKTNIRNVVYRCIPDKNFFSMSGHVNSHGIFNGKMTLDPNSRKYKHPVATYLPNAVLDESVGLIVFTYSGIITPVKSNEYCKIMKGQCITTEERVLRGKDQKGPKCTRAIALALELNEIEITRAIMNAKRFGDSVAPELPENATPEEKMENERVLLTTGEYQEILAFSTKHLFPNDKGGKKLVQHTVKLRAYRDDETGAIKLGLSERHSCGFDESRFEGGIPSVPECKIFEVYNYPVKPNPKPFKRNNNSKQQNNGRKPSGNKPYKGNGTKPPYKGNNKNGKPAQGNGKPHKPGNKPNAPYKGKNNKPVKNDKPYKGKPNGNNKPQGNTNNKPKPKKQTNNKPKKPQFNKNGIPIA